MATAECAMQIGGNQAKAADPNDKTAIPEWRRWNNYGIALFDQRQYPLAIDAFARAAELDEKYRPMALTNRAMAHIELEQYDEAAAILDAIVKANPTNMRPTFQQARICIKPGQLSHTRT